jgi:hypothetical protein
MEDKDFIYGQITVKIEEIKQQNAKLLTQAQQLHLEHDFQNRLCSTGCKFLVLTSRHEIGVVLQESNNHTGCWPCKISNTIDSTELSRTEQMLKPGMKVWRIFSPHLSPWFGLGA